MSIVFSDRFRYTLIVSFYKERIFLKHSLIRFSAVVLTIAFVFEMCIRDRAGILLCTALTGAVPVSHGQRLHSLLLTLGDLVLTLIPPSRVRAVGLLLGMGYCLGILMAMYARGSDAALLMLSLIHI